MTKFVVMVAAVAISVVLGATTLSAHAAPTSKFFSKCTINADVKVPAPLTLSANHVVNVPLCSSLRKQMFACICVCGIRYTCHDICFVDGTGANCGWCGVVGTDCRPGQPPCDQLAGATCS